MGVWEARADKPLASRIERKRKNKKNDQLGRGEAVWKKVREERERRDAKNGERNERRRGEGEGESGGRGKGKGKHSGDPHALQIRLQHCRMRRSIKLCWQRGVPRRVLHGLGGCAHSGQWRCARKLHADHGV